MSRIKLGAALELELGVSPDLEHAVITDLTPVSYWIA